MVLVSREVRQRRQKVTTLTVRGLSPGEIGEILNVPRDTVYNDIRTIRSGRNEDLVAHSRREILAQLLLNARERTRQLWEIIESADSDYVKLLALRELRIHDQNVLKHLIVLSNALKVGERAGLLDNLKRRFAGEPEDAGEVTESLAASPATRKSSGSATPGVMGEVTESLAAPPAARKSSASATPEVAQPPLTVVEDTVAEPDSVYEDEKEPVPAQPETTQVSQDPPCGFVKTCRNPLADKGITLQTASGEIAPAGGERGRA